MARKSKFKEEVDEINLIPIMNLVLCLIPVVLYKTQLVKIGVIDVNAPQISNAPSPTPPDPNDKPLGLNLTVYPDKLVISAADGQLAALYKKPSVEVKVTGQSAVDKTMRDYDYVDLYQKMKKIRNFFIEGKGEKKEKELLKIKAEADVEFKYIIRIMDVLRYEVDAEQSTSTLRDLDNAVVNKKFTKLGEGDTQVYKALWAYVTFDTAAPKAAADSK